MKILCVSPWNNTWVGYWTKALEANGHEVKWHINHYPKPADVAPLVDWADKILCHWADKYAIMLTDPVINKKPLYVILRSYEIFSADGWSDLALINWDNISGLFMLNESHYYVFKQRVPNIEPKFIKNGIDLEEWKFNGHIKDLSKIALICDINEKKGIELLVQAISELTKENKDITLEHIGRNQDIRRWYYLENIMPKLNTQWYNIGYKNSHGFVQTFLGDKGFIISTSIAEGNPMNLMEAMALGVVPLIHNWPGAEIQFPKEYVWATFDELKSIYKRCVENYAEEQKRCRQWVEEKYNYRKNFQIVIEEMQK
jgi:glycosyltransferase involved in cell wall biosynthesis